MNTQISKPNLQRLLLAAFENITVGLPFCVFKLACGFFFLSNYPENLIVKITGFLIFGLGAVDLLINSFNLLTILVARKQFLDECLIAIFLRIIKLPKQSQTSARVDLGKSLDVLLSFSIVALMIGNGSIRLFDPQILNAWNISVILNVLGAGLARFSSSLKAASIHK